MKNIEDVKAHVGQLVAEKGYSYNSLSIKLGKNPTYLQKFVKEKSPKRLDEEFRAKLAIILNVPEQELTDRDLSAPALPASISGAQALAEAITSGVSSLVQKFAAKKDDIISIDMLDATACCGNGIENLTENISGKWLMPLVDFRQISMSSPENIKLLKVRGDSMEPTLKEGDWVLVDITHVAPDSDGMFLLRMSTGLAVKRLQGGITQDVIVKSDNPKYDNITANIGEIRILGKVIYTLKADKVG